MLTLGERVARREADGFVGRVAELRLFEEALSGRLDRNVLLVHGPGGIGKSALLRAFARRAGELGREVWSSTGNPDPPGQPLPGHAWTLMSPVEASTRPQENDCPGVSPALSPAVVEGCVPSRPVVLVDDAAGCAQQLRETQLPRLPEGAVVVVASRQPPDEGWRTGGWERVVLDMPLVGFDDADSFALLADCGVRDEAVCRRILSFAEGSPLALTVAAGAVRAGRDARVERDRVYAELGLTAQRSPLTVEVVRQALRRLHDPVALAETPLAQGARGGSPSERSDHARAVLVRAMRQAFGDGRHDIQLRMLIRQRYVVEPDIGHDALARKLSISRATYFRRLHDALERVTTWLALAD